jgi:hypothetical protein
MKAANLLFRTSLILGCIMLFWQPVAAETAKQAPADTADQHAGIVEKEAETIDELVEMVDQKKCAECHPEIYKEWKESWHAKSVVSPGAIKGIHNFFAIGLPKEWKKPITKAEVMKCYDCHAPVIQYASEKLAVEIANMVITAHKEKGKPAAEKAEKELSKLSVGCISCHNLKAITVARGLRGDPKKGAIYGPTGADSNGAHETIETVDITRSVFCMQCHGKYKAPDGETIQCNTLSGSFQNAYGNLGGSDTCQSCHMEKNSKTGKKSHIMPGGHNLDMVKKGLELDVNFTQYRHLPGQIKGVKDDKAWVPSAVVTAFVANKAGHRIPDG